MNAVTFESPPGRTLVDFLQAHWERRPGTIAGANPARDDDRLLFRAMCAASRRARLGDNSVEFVVWLDGSKIAFNEAFAPRPGDGSLHGYLERLDACYRDTDFTVLLADPHLYDRELWTRARRWARLIAGEVGMPNGGVDTCAFVGCYCRTPFGVHRGQMSVLTMPVIGRKRFLLWPYTYGHQHPEIQDSLDYAAHLDRAIVEQSEPGDLLYWPADFWHVADAARHPTAAWNLGFWWDRPPLSRVLAAAAETMATDSRVSECDPFAFGWNHNETDRALDSALREFRDFSASGALSDAMALQSARFISADGFRAVPEPASPVRPQCDQVRMSGRVVLRELDDRRWCLAANGHLLLLDECSDRTRIWLEHLQAGETVSLQQAGHDEIPAFLAATQALSPVGASTSGTTVAGGAAR